MNSLRDKMSNYEVPPPAGVWDRVVAALDEAEQGSSFVTALQQMEATPPHAAWKNISSALETEETATPVVKPVYRRLPQIVRYAAAVILLLLATYGVMRLTSDVEESASPTVSSPPPVFKDSPGTHPVSPLDAVAANPASVPATETHAQAQPASREASVRFARNARSNTAAMGETLSASGLTRAIYTYNDHVPKIADRYITLLTPDGSFIRMAKKWGNLLCCVAGEEQDVDCKNQLKAWQDKLAESSVLSAPGNFMDIVTLVNSLNDDTQL
ncbi:MAG: hypothetical protein JNL59_00270 [Chitinophagaceae bacterium]|jgi:hypothetical protein|nr:hypothetical protein [Chitinophagaceae bacterium]